MISEKMAKCLNEQINKEFYSAYLYLAMSSWCSKEGFDGSANWFMVQYQEETSHGMKIYNYMLNQDAKINLQTIKEPKIDYESLIKCFEESLVHERSMTNSFNELCDIAIKEKDHASYGFLQWFVEEQVEEEATVCDVIAKLKLVKDGNGIYMIDNQLLTRNLENN